jgi:hypothetical protein
MANHGRGLSPAFFEALKSGCLSPLLQRVHTDETLFLAIRANYINIYYRGGNLMMVKANAAQQKEGFSIFFDVNHIPKPSPQQADHFARTCEALRSDIHALLDRPVLSASDTEHWVEAIPKLKLAIDLGLGMGGDKHEREFQQLVARENNRSGISNETEYFIADIEYASSALGARFDMLAVQWLAHQRKDGSNCKLALIEMKYGDHALTGNSGLASHLKQAKRVLEDAGHYEALKREMETVFRQMRDLDLIRFGSGGNRNEVRFKPEEAPELIFLLANHNPRSPKLKEVLRDIQAAGYATTMPVRFYVAGFAGYGIHVTNLVTLDELLKSPLLHR